MKGSGLRRMTAVIAICALVGALAGIAGSAAAPSKSTQAQKKAAKAKKVAKAKAQAQKRTLLRARRGGPGLRSFGPRPGGPDGGPVHSETVVPNADGTGFETITADAGILKSVDGSTLHIKQGTDKATYKEDAAIDVGSDPTVVRNHEKAALSDLKEGDHVRVIKAPKGTFVMAEDDAFIAQEKKERKRFFGHHRFGPGGPPPGAPYPGDEKGSNENGSGSGTTDSGGTNS
jgi:hypothetical protein